LFIVHQTAQARWQDSEEDGSLSSIVTIAIELHTRGAYNVGKLCGSSRGEAAAHTAVKTLEEFFYADCVGGHDKQNILYLELVINWTNEIL
jgi:hypothetical protein